VARTTSIRFDGFRPFSHVATGTSSDVAARSHTWLICATIASRFLFWIDSTITAHHCSDHLVKVPCLANSFDANAAADSVAPRLFRNDSMLSLKSTPSLCCVAYRQQ
jgi:hypothetical protein